MRGLSLNKFVFLRHIKACEPLDEVRWNGGRLYGNMIFFKFYIAVVLILKIWILSQFLASEISR
jgi:hypothetical protein